jgi:hypothetical protein
MTDVAAIEMPPELVPPVPEGTVEVDVAPTEAMEPVAAAPVETVDQAAPDGDAAVASELVYPNGGSTSAAVLDHFADSAEGGDQSIAQIIAGLGGTVSRNTIESAVRRLHEARRLLRVAPAHTGLRRRGSPSRPSSHRRHSQSLSAAAR